MTSILNIPRENHFTDPKQLLPINNASMGVPNTKVGPLDIPATFPQSERLFTTRSRSVNSSTNDGNRGERAYIKLLTTDKTRSMNRADGGHDSQPTSLGTSSGGVLNDAINASGYASFLITDLQCSLDEKLQVVEVFGDAEVTYYFGRQPIMFNISGVLIDSVDNNWFVEWMEMYSHVLRGTQLARNYELIKLVFPNMELIGTITRTAWSQNSARDVDVPFQFSFLAKHIIPKPVVANSKPITNDPVVNWGTASSFFSKADQNNLKAISASELYREARGLVSDPTATTKDYANVMTAMSFLSGKLGSGLSSIGTEPINLGTLGTGLGSIPSAASATSTLTDKISNAAGSGAGFFDSTKSVFNGISSNLSGIRASLFSPVYGVLSSLTKLIKGVGGAIGAVMGVFTNPVRDILRDVRNISFQAIGVVNAVNNQINSLTNEINNVNSDLITTVSLLKKTAGVITTAPESINLSLRRLVNAGKLSSNSKFLTSRDYKKLPNGTRTNSKLALLNSGKRHTPERGARL